MNITPIQKKRVYQNIIEQIKMSIENGELKPGDKLPSERELAERLHVSRGSVREAFSVLESAGIVGIFPGKGVFLKGDENKELLVRMNDILDQPGVNLIEILEVRQGIEGHAAYLAAMRRTDSDLKIIENAYRNLESAVSRHQVAAKEDFQFHLSIVKASHNKMLLQAVELFSDTFLQGVHHSRSKSMLKGETQLVLKEHLAIYKAIREKDPERAQKAMWEHLKSVENRHFQSN